MAVPRKACATGYRDGKDGATATSLSGGTEREAARRLANPSDSEGVLFIFQFPTIRGVLMGFGLDTVMDLAVQATTFPKTGIYSVTPLNSQPIFGFNGF